MVKPTIEDAIEGMLKEDNPQSDAVKSLITVKEKEKGKLGSDIELKTDLTENEVVIHTGIDMMNRILEVDDFDDVLITQDLVQIKERKLLSKNRKSRQEIVEVARNPDTNVMQEGGQESFVKRMFTPRK